MTEEILAGQATPVQEAVIEAENGATAPTTPAPAAAPAPRRLRLDELKAGEVMPGVVKNIAQFGAFIDIGAEQDGLVHISELSENRVRRVEDVVKTGQDVEVTILEVDRSRKRISLSMKPRYDVYDKVDEESANEEELLSPMQLAFQRAEEKRESQNNAAKEREKSRKEQEDLLDRTLRQHRTQK